MTLRGILSLVLEAFLLIMALGTGIRDFRIIAVSLGVLILFSLLSVLLAEACLKFKSISDKTEFYRSEEIKYTLEMKGPVILPVVGRMCIKPADNGDITDKKSLRHTFFLFPRFKLRRTYDFKIFCAHTGLWKIGAEKMRISDIFGFFSLPLFRTRKREAIIPLSVLPQLHEFDEENIFVNAALGFGDAARYDSESGELLGDSRLYRDGDTMRRINWKLTARTRKLYTRQFELPEIPKVVIAIDDTAFKDNTGKIADIACETAVSAAKYYLEQDTHVNIITLRARGKEERKSFDYYHLRELPEVETDLITINFVKEDAPSEIYRLNQGKFAGADKIYVISANPSDGLLSAIEEEIKSGRLAICIIPQLNIEPEACVKKAIEDTGANPIMISSVEEISEKVGGRA